MSKKVVKCDSGEIGIQSRLREIYDNYDEFLVFNKMYNITERLGYNTPKSLWEDNPIVQGSSNPKDFKIVDKK